jgi:hypothetical protein
VIVFLSLLVCTLSGNACHVTVPTQRPFVGLSACQVEGMQTAASWTGAHPGWRVIKIRCTLGKRPLPEDQV